jgi:hypothetical protein
MRNMSRKIAATVLALAVPAAASAGPGASPDPDSPAGPIRTAIEKAGDDIVAAKRQEVRSRGRLWTGIGLIAGGTVLGVLSRVELGDDEAGPDDGEDIDGSDDGEDSDGWGNKAMLGGGIAAATVGGVILMTGKKSGPVVAAKRGGFAIRQTIRF